MWAVLDVENSRPCKGCEVTTMKKFPGLHGLCFFCLLCWQVSAHAVCPFTMSLTQTQFDMGTTTTGTFQITNSGSPSNIIALRFRINNGDHFSGTTAAAAGWTVAFSNASGGGYNTITYSATAGGITPSGSVRSEEHTSELQSHSDLVCRLLLEKKKKTNCMTRITAGESVSS